MKIRLGSLSDDDGIQKLEYAMAWLTQYIPNPPSKYPQKWNLVNFYHEETRDVTMFIDFLHEHDAMWFLESVK